MVNIYDLTMLQHAWVQGGRCQKQSDSNKGFLPNSIFPNTELTGGEGGTARHSAQQCPGWPQRKQTRDGPEGQDVLVVAADAAVAAADVTVAVADASAAAAVARGAVKPTATDDDDVDDLCRPVCRERCHGLHGPVETRRPAPGRRLAPLHLWPGRGCRRHLRCSSSSPRPEPGLPPVHRGQCLSSVRTYFSQHQSQREGHLECGG